MGRNWYHNNTCVIRSSIEDFNMKGDLNQKGGCSLIGNKCEAFPDTFEACVDRYKCLNNL